MAKIRKGFVSNSSSSSFCIMGLVKDERFNEAKEDKWGNLDLSGTCLSYAYGVSDYYESTLIGVGPESMKEDETLSEFKGRIAEDFKKIGVEITKDDLDWHIDGGYDG